MAEKMATCRKFETEGKTVSKSARLSAQTVASNSFPAALMTFLVLPVSDGPAGAGGRARADADGSLLPSLLPSFLMERSNQSPL